MNYIRETLSGLNVLWVLGSQGCRASRSNPGLGLANAFGVSGKKRSCFALRPRLANAFGVSGKKRSCFALRPGLANAIGVIERIQSHLALIVSNTISGVTPKRTGTMLVPI